MAALSVALTSACGGTKVPAPGELIRDYAQSADVKNDRFPGGGSGADRTANFAAQGYTPDTLAARLLATYECAGRLCRSLLVKHADGSLELLILHVIPAEKVTDSTGDSYRDLDDFRAHNDLLDDGDVLFTLTDLTSSAGTGEIVTVTGHTPSIWRWVLPAAGALLLILTIIHIIRRAAHRRRWDPAPPDPGVTG
jgi:hypothetical protein